MLVKDFECRSYEQAREYLGGRTQRTACNNTALVTVRGSDFVNVYLHGHVIMEFWADGHIVLDSCGYRTVTTKDRINRCLPDPWQVRQLKGDWWLWNNRYAMGDHQEGDILKVLFVDEMTVPGTGTRQKE